MRTDNIVRLEELAKRLRTAMEAERQEFLDKQATYDEEHKNKKHVITDEERKRMEESRKRALK